MSNNELNNVKDALRRIANQLDVMSQTSGTPQASQATSQGSHTNMGDTGTPAIPDSNSLNYSAASSTASQEHKKLFAAYSRTPAQRNTYSGSGKGKGKGKRVPTCTLKVFCLSRTDASKPPIAVRDRTILINAGLGDASIQFKTDASSVECHQEIVSRFPKLLETGYELLLYQRGGDAGFYNIATKQASETFQRW